MLAMIVVRAPMRISFVGGGTDLAEFYRESPGAVISTAIDKFVYVAINRTPLIDKVSARYSISETVDHPAEEPPDASTRDLVFRALAGLAPQQRAVVVLRHWLDLDVETTARTLGCSTGTVKSTNARALAHLRDALATITDDLTTRSNS